MEFTAAQIAAMAGGEVIGDQDRLITGVTPIEDGQPGCLSFVSQEKFIDYIHSSPCAVLIISRKLFTGKVEGKTLILVDDAYLTFQELMAAYSAGNRPDAGVHSTVIMGEHVELGSDIGIGAYTVIEKNVKIGEGSRISAGCYIGKSVRIGKNVHLAPGVKVMDFCQIGNNCIIHSNTVIGSDGFGFQPTASGFQKIPQLGNVVLQDQVEIGSNCSIDRGTIGSTVIGEGTKIDNLIQIAHNVKIGKHNVIAAQTGIAGSTVIGDWNMIGGQVGIVGHILIGNKNKIQAQSGINKGIRDENTLYGSPAFEASDFRRSYVHFRNLERMATKISELESRLDRLKDIKE